MVLSLKLNKFIVDFADDEKIKSNGCLIVDITNIDAIEFSYKDATVNLVTKNATTFKLLEVLNSENENYDEKFIKNIIDYIINAIYVAIIGYQDGMKIPFIQKKLNSKFESLLFHSKDW